LIGTNRIDGRATASQIASASFASFLSLLGFHQPRTHELYPMAQPPELVRPVVRAGAGFQAHQARRQLAHELEQVLAN
jgi:hypothetical protein